MDKQGILSWPNPSPETVLFFSGRVEPPHDSQEDLRDDLSVNSLCRTEGEEDRDEVLHMTRQKHKNSKMVIKELVKIFDSRLEPLYFVSLRSV